MQYIKLDNNTWVEVNQETSSTRLVRKSDVEAQIVDCEALLQQAPTDEQLLQWARENHPYQAQTQAIQATIDTFTELLTHLV